MPIRKTHEVTSNEPGTHAASDLYYAAFLLSSGLDLVKTRRDGPRVVFLFSVDPDDDVEQLKIAWHSGKGEVSAQAYAQNLKNLKDLAFHQRD
jgi:hypothetical protein